MILESNQTKWVRLGNYIEKCDERNSELIFNEDDVRGVNNEATFCNTKAKLEGINFRPYKIVHRGDFVYNPARLDIGSLAYRNEGDCIVSTLYVVFRIRHDKEKELDPIFLLMYFNRDEFCRYIKYSNWGSAREYFWYDDMEELLIPLPSIKKQRAIVDVWKSLKKIKEENEALAVPLMQICQSYIQECKHKYPLHELREYIEDPNDRNKDNLFGAKDLMGVNCEGNFIVTKANTDGLNFSNYKIVRNGEFSYSNRINIGSIALNRGKDCIVSPSYAVFRLVDKGQYLLPDYLALWFRRSEFLRSTLFFAFGTIKDDFSIENMKSSLIPVPPIPVQKVIVSLYNCSLEYKRIAIDADAESRRICPALLQHVINN